mgnify:CR=1 FL=1
MTNKQIKKMLCLEGIFYGMNSLIYGISISVGILYIMCLYMIDTSIYSFNISFVNIVISVIATYIMIFISMEYSKKSIINKKLDNYVK